MMLMNEKRDDDRMSFKDTRITGYRYGSADIVVGAVGKPEFIKGSWIKDGAIVVDAGYHPGNIGDIELSAVIDRCYAYTPVPRWCRTDDHSHIDCSGRRGLGRKVSINPIIR